MRVPHNWGDNITLVAALTPSGPGPAMALAGALDGPAFLAYVRECLAPALVPGQTVILANLAVHERAAARRLVEARGCRFLFLPPYSPDYNPIELAFATLKAALRRRPRCHHPPGDRQLVPPLRLPTAGPPVMSSALKHAARTDDTRARTRLSCATSV